MKHKYSFKFDSEILEYDVRMKRRRNWWWLLLLLLLPLLLIRCSHDLEVTCYDPEFDITVPDVEVSLSSVEHYIYKEGQFFGTDTISMTQVTDSVGKTIFRDLPSSVFSRIFYCLSSAVLDVTPDCYRIEEPESILYHYRRHVTLDLVPVTLDLPVCVIDLETEEVIPGATIRWNDGFSSDDRDSLTTDATGKALLQHVRLCSRLSFVSASAYGYADTLVEQIDVRPIAESALPLVVKSRPVKASFTFFVLNSITHQPVPSAEAQVTLTSRGGTAIVGNVQTNVDGQGKGFFDDGAILAQLDITASKVHYTTGRFDWDPYGTPNNVDHFTQLADSQRVVYIEPTPYVVEFVVLDSITHKPVPGVTNDITITHLDGSQEVLSPEVTNANGVFPIEAREGEVIDIISTNDPEYKRKKTHIEPFERPDTIYIVPNHQSVTFRTVTPGGQLLSNCALSIRTQNGRQAGFPTNSGNGTFVVPHVLPDDKLYITARKGNGVNSSKINGQTVSTLMAGSQQVRDIPVTPDFTYQDTRQGSSTQNYDLGDGAITFEFSWSVCGACTMLSVICGNQTLATVGFGGSTSQLASGSLRLQAPNGNIKIVFLNNNGHLGNYRIRRLN